jgi:hypothetical protein
VKVAAEADGVPRRDGEPGDDTGVVGDHPVLHLHRLQHDDQVALLDVRPFLDGDLHDRPLHRRGDRVARP